MKAKANKITDRFAYSNYLIPLAGVYFLQSHECRMTQISQNILRILPTSAALTKISRTVNEGLFEQRTIKSTIKPIELKHSKWIYYNFELWVRGV
jgi:hypothetical protein